MIADRHKNSFNPCPFCGGMAELVFWTIDGGDYPDRYEYFVMCQNCYAETAHYDYPEIPNADEYAIASWNTRYPMPRENA